MIDWPLFGFKKLYNVFSGLVYIIFTDCVIGTGTGEGRGNVMLSVLVVEKDDRQRKRFLSLVNWGVYGCKVVGQCGDGIAAMEAILRVPPDLVFTNDDLPRLSGIELIEHIQSHGIECDFAIVSESGSFKVAQKAMRMGVEEYLLKPVARDELVRVLKKYTERGRTANIKDINEKFVLTKRQLRNSFMDVFTAPNAPEYYSIEFMNQKYNFRLRDGVFRSAIILVRGIPAEENVEFFESMIEDVRARFDPLCYEMIPFYQGHFRVSFTFNYGEGSGVDEKLPGLFDIVREHLDSCGYENAVFSVGIGLPEYDSMKLRRTLETAERAVRCGILRGQNKLYSYEKLEFDKMTSLDIMTPTMMNELKSCAGALDTGGFEDTVRNAFRPVSYRSNPAVLIDICWAAVDAVESALKTEGDTGGLQDRRKILDRLGSETTMDGTISVLVSWAAGLFEKRLEEREFANPVREAVRYIEAHCTEPLTLNLVAEQAHLNASYFCTIFRKETGQKFSDYLAGCRIREAKRLLRESNLKIAQVCSAVGYTDYKHFCHIFVKSTGVKPSAYRALHG